MQKTEKLIKNYIEEKLRSHSQGLLVDKMNAHAFSDDGNGGVIAGVEIMCNWVNLCDHRTIQNGFPINFKQSDKTNFSILQHVPDPSPYVNLSICFIFP